MKRRRWVVLIVVAVAAGVFGWLAFWSPEPAPWTTYAYTSRGATVGRMGKLRDSEIRFLKPDEFELKDLKESVPAFRFSNFYDMPEGGLPGVGRPFGLDLSYTHVLNADLAKLASLGHLTHLDLSDTGMNDAGLVHLTGLKYLTHLDLSSTEVEGDGLIHLAELPRLRVLVIGRKVTEEKLAALKRLAPDCRVVR